MRGGGRVSGKVGGGSRGGRNQEKWVVQRRNFPLVKVRDNGGVCVKEVKIGGLFFGTEMQDWSEIRKRGFRG